MHIGRNFLDVNMLPETIVKINPGFWKEYENRKDPKSVPFPIFTIDLDFD